MSRLDELIKEMCPNGVDSFQLEDIAEFRRGSFPQPYGNAEWYGGEGAMPFVQVADMDDVIFYLHASTKQMISTIAQPKSVFVETGTVLVSLQGTIGRVAITQYDCYVDRTVAIFTNYKIDIDKRYFAYQLKRKFDIEKEFARGSTLKTITKAEFSKFTLPVPPLEVQHEIVRILDSFTSLTAELIAKCTAELTARKKQYEYYRDDLLTFKGEIPKVTLGEIATDIYRGSGIKRDEITEAGIPCVRYGEIYTQYNTWFKECVSHTHLENVSSPKWFEHGDILFAITGESVEDIAKSVAYLGHEKCLAGGDIVVLKHKQEPRYLAHVLATYEARQQKSKGKIKSKVVHSSVPYIKQIEIPLPSLEVQKKYADVLDNFQKICNDLNITLPAEIEARKKQYEFYRDALLTYAATGEIIFDRQTDRQTELN